VAALHRRTRNFAMDAQTRYLSDAKDIATRERRMPASDADRWMV